jgi:hypothetical protein
MIASGFTFISLYSMSTRDSVYLLLYSHGKLTVIEMRWGLGIHFDDMVAIMPRTEIERHYYLDLFIGMWLYTFSIGFSKFVILGFYWRMFSTSLMRQPVRILFGLSALWILSRVGQLDTLIDSILKTTDRDHM